MNSKEIAERILKDQDYWNLEEISEHNRLHDDWFIREQDAKKAVEMALDRKELVEPMSEAELLEIIDIQVSVREKLEASEKNELAQAIHSAMMGKENP
ncbi:hypothetical protein KKH13_05050 [Patescibacteria group bacterium]|nr:hypothetical protein [Patescibacteria group bacterium]